MQFPGFYGSRTLRNRLSMAADHNALGHCYILSGPEGSGKHTLARLISAAAQCTGSGERPCGSCPNCHKIFGHGHPDVITIDSDKSTIPVDTIRAMRADAFVRPNEGSRKVYIIPRAQDMMDPAQNALLKILEEPPSYCLFLLLTDSADKLLTTVRSRAVELIMSPLSDSELMSALVQLRPNSTVSQRNEACEYSDGLLGKALSILDGNLTAGDPRLSELVSAIAAGNRLQILYCLVPWEKLDRPSVLSMVSQLYQMLIKAMRFREDPSIPVSSEPQLLASLPVQKLSTMLTDLQSILTMLQANGNVGACVGFLLACLAG